MKGLNSTVTVELTQDEAHEVLMRCLQSIEKDTAEFHSAIKKLARAIDSEHDSSKKAA